MKFQRKALAAIALILVAAGCDQVERAGITAPAFSSNKKQQAFVQRISALSAGETKCAYHVSPGQTATIEIGANRLDIPKKATNGPASYCMTLKPGSLIGVELHAYDEKGVEFHAFRTSPRLTISYSDAVSVGNQALKIVYVVNGAVVETLGTSQDRINKTVTSILKHFSDYHVVTDTGEGADTLLPPIPGGPIQP